MLDTVTRYISDRRGGLTRVASYAGSVYLAAKYVTRSLQETRDNMMHDRIARENLRRRFEQNQQDISFTIMALLPTLGTHILEGMDVEGVTQELQSQSRASKAQKEASQSPPAMSAPDASSSLPHHEQDANSDSGSASVSSFSGKDDGESSELAASSTSWVDQFSSPHSSQPSQQHSPEASGSAFSEPRQQAGSPRSNIETDLSDSMITTSSVSYGDVAAQNHPPSSSPFTRSKAELWKEVKMLTFTRTLTVLYSMTLLSLFSHVQLNILGRSKYIQSVIQLACDECQRECLFDSTSISSLFGGQSPESPDLSGIIPVPPISEENERKYLTLSWWVLHVGWKDVGESVRRAVEEVFEGVSLKTKLSASDLHRLLNDVRRRVEFEVTFEGTEKRMKFTSTLLPPTSETLQHVLAQGGIPSHLTRAHDTEFQSLLFETRKLLSSGSFELVLEACLDKATEVLFHGLETNVFGGASGGWEDPNSALGSTPEPRVRLAGMLPGLARWCQLALAGHPNELIDGLAEMMEVTAFSAIIYSEYDDLLQ